MRSRQDPDALPAGPQRPASGIARQAVHALWAAETWHCTLHLMAGALLAAITCSVMLVLLSVTTVLGLTVVLAVPGLYALVRCSRGFTALQRSRFAALQDVHLPPTRRPWESEPTWWRRVLAEARAQSTHKQVLYHTLACLICPLGGFVVAAMWANGLVMATIAVQPGGRASVLGLDMDDPLTLAVLTMVGLGLILAAPWAARALAGLDVTAARALLAPSGPEQVADLARRVETLSASRAGVVDAADVERRRIERDLHDGTQQRLVALAMRLGMTHASLTDAPEPVRKAIGQAHREAKEALSELRDLIRGLHPAVLDDLGLDAALSGLAARSPVPVRLRVDLPHRPPPACETVAYFVVSEALTNVARHAAATQVHLSATHHLDGGGERVRVMVTDDGRGGARERDHDSSGLRGLRQRVGSVDGTLDIDSPPGGPTRIMVELPCAS